MFARFPLRKNVKSLLTSNLVLKRDFKNFKKKRSVPHHWQKQSELLSDMGMHVGNDPAHPDTVAQTEMLEELRDDVQDMYIRDNPRMKGMFGSEDYRRKRLKLRKIIEKKYFRKPQEENLLTYDAKEQIRYLNSEYPEEWTPERIAESFPISAEGAKLFLRKTVKMRYLEDVIRHDWKVKQRWRELKTACDGEGGPLNNRYKQLLEAGQTGLLKHAAGYTSLPMPEKIPLPSKHSRYLNRDPNKPPGPWASIVHDYCELQDNLTGKTRDLITEGKFEHVPQKPRTDHKAEQAKLLEDVTSSIQRKKSAQSETKKKGSADEKLVKDQHKDKSEKEFQGWFRFDDDAEANSQESKSTRKVVLSTMLQNVVDEDLAHLEQQVCTGLRGKSSLRRRRMSLPPQIVEQRSLQKMLHSNQDLEDMSEMFKNKRKTASEVVKRVSDEMDPGLAGTQKIISKGVSYTELLKQDHVKDVQTRTSTFSARQGAYGYFEHEADTKTKMRNVRDNTKDNATPEISGAKQYPPGDVRSEPRSDVIHEKNDEYYDESGQFLFKTPKAR